jgi:hypothetical protein
MGKLGIRKFSIVWLLHFKYIYIAIKMIFVNIKNRTVQIFEAEFESLKFPAQSDSLWQANGYIAASHSLTRVPGACFSPAPTCIY